MTKVLAKAGKTKMDRKLIDSVSRCKEAARVIVISSKREKVEKEYFLDILSASTNNSFAQFFKNTFGDVKNTFDMATHISKESTQIPYQCPSKV